MASRYFPSKDELKIICEQASYNFQVDSTVAFNLVNQANAEQAFKTQGELLYGRFGNQASHRVEDVVSAIDGATSSLATTSGTTANFLLLLTLCGRGSQQLASSQHIFGGTYGGQNGILKTAGIKTDYFDPRDPRSLQKLLKNKPKTGAVFLETISNADNVIPDFEGIIDIAQHYKKPVIIDNTYAFGEFQPFRWGADFSTVSLTKAAGGGGNNVLGGIIQSRGDSGTQSWLTDNSKLYQAISDYHSLNPANPDPAMSVMYGYSGSGIGTPLQSDAAMTILKGLQTLPERTAAYNANAALVAAHLDQDKFKEFGFIKHVNHLSLAHHPDHDKVDHYMPGHYGSVMLVDFGTKQRAAAFIDNSGYVGVHIMQNQLMVTHPSTTTHRQYTQDMRNMIGVHDGTVRITVGNENSDVIMNKVERGLDAVMAL